MTIVEGARPVVGGVDTHLDVHVAAAVDGLGGLLGVRSFPTTPAGYHALSSWLGSFGPIERVGVEGTGTYGAGLARHLAVSGITVLEVDRPNRQERRRNGKSDELDAIEAARAVLSGRARGYAKGGDGNVEALRALLVAKRSARSIRIKTTGQLRHLVITAPDELRNQLAGLTTKSLITQAAALRPRVGGDPVRHGTKTAIVALARRVQTINDEIALLDRHLDTLVRTTCPRLLEIYGVGVDTAAILLVAAGDNTRTHPFRSRVGAPMRCRTDPRRLRQDQRAATPEPRRESPSEPCAVAHRAHPPRSTRTTNRRLHATPPRPRPNKDRDHQITQALHRTRDLPTDLRVTREHQVAVTGLAQDCPDALGCPSIDLPSRHRHPHPTPGLIRACPPSGPSLVCQQPGVDLDNT